MQPAPALLAHPRYLAALLAWQIELGADACVGDAGVDRYAEGAPPPRRIAPAAPVAGPLSAPPPAAPSAVRSAAPSAGPSAAPPAEQPAQGTGARGVAADPVAAAQAAAAAAASLAALAEAQAAYPHCALRQGARNFVFADGLAGARVMVIGEAPGHEEDATGRPFVGRAGQLLDRMFAAIGLARTAAAPADALYITNVMPWRPPGNREPTAEEVAMMLPFLARHVALAAPSVVVVMGNTPAQAVLGARGITRLRGQWAEAWGRPVLPMLHPAYLLRQPQTKREAWADLLSLQAHLRAGGPP